MVKVVKVTPSCKEVFWHCGAGGVKWVQGLLHAALFLWLCPNSGGRPGSSRGLILVPEDPEGSAESELPPSLSYRDRNRWCIWTVTVKSWRQIFKSLPAERCPLRAGLLVENWGMFYDAWVHRMSSCTFIVPHDFQHVCCSEEHYTHPVVIHIQVYGCPPECKYLVNTTMPLTFPTLTCKTVENMWDTERCKGEAAFGGACREEQAQVAVRCVWSTNEDFGGSSSTNETHLHVVHEWGLA